MPYFVSSGDPTWSFDPMELEKQVANFAKANGITTQSAWTAFIAGLATAPPAVSRGLLSSVKCSVP